jgi:acetyl esterase/lipase
MTRPLFLALALPLAAKDLALEIPGLPHEVQVSLPENFDPAKQHPTLFYYHGTSGRPTTSLMRSHAGKNDWIIVGMTYRETGQFQLTPESMAAELEIYHTVRKLVTSKHGADPARIYAAGFSKGGWHTNLLLQAEPTLAGGLILGAGHFHIAPGAMNKYASKKPVHIGIGRKDGNYPLALKALLHHRQLGANVTFEVWPTLGHAYPEKGSDSIKQWLALQTHSADALAPVAAKELPKMLAEAKSLKPLAQWDRLREIKDMPYFDLTPKSWQFEFQNHLAGLEAVQPIATEAMLFAKHRRLLHQEITNNTLASLKKVNFGYLDLSSKHPGTRQGKLLEEDFKRTEAMLKNIKVAPAPKPTTTEVPTGPVPDRKIPRNPLIR